MKRKAAISPAPVDQEASYPTKDWLVPASDSQGHGERISVRVPTGMAHLINVAIASGTFPWKQPAECIRWCIDRGLKEIQKQTKDPDFKSVHTTFNMFRRSASTQMEMLSCSRALTQLKGNLDELIREKAVPAAAKLLESVKADMREIEDPYWRGRYRDLVTEYGAIITGAPKDRRFTGRVVHDRDGGNGR